jgi:acyl-CoA thioester hydrolase
MCEQAVTYRGSVYPWQCDHMEHMNVMWYTGKFDEASWQLLTRMGLTQSRFDNEGVGMAAAEQHIEYKRELYAGDVITIHSTILEVGEKSIRLRHHMTNDQTREVVAISTIVGVHLDTALRKARPLPSDVRERAIEMIHIGSRIAIIDPPANESVQTTALACQWKVEPAPPRANDWSAAMMWACL